MALTAKIAEIAEIAEFAENSKRSAIAENDEFAGLSKKT